MPTDSSTMVFRMQNSGERPIRIREVEAPEAFVVDWPQAPIFEGDVVAIYVGVAPGAAVSADGARTVGLVTDDALQPRKTLVLGARGGDGP